jgi:hypothetical protein
MKFTKFGYEVKISKLVEDEGVTILKAFVDGEYFCTVSKFDTDAEWTAHNELTDRSGETAKEAVKSLMEVLY